MTCSNWEARNTKEKIGERVTYFRTVRGVNHTFWGGPKIVDEVYPEFRNQLINPENRDSDSYFVTD